MSQAKKYSVIMPTYNELENLPVMTFLLLEQADKQ
jgi:glycosyltransferase involved in cell wall biosynthesis